MEIFWDSWGVFYIFVVNEIKLMEVFGWVQVWGYGDLFFILYGEVRGKGVEYWGIDYFDNDQYVYMMNIFWRLEVWLNV